MKLAFDEAKATQAAALFLKLADRSLNYMALIKLLYRADREAIRRWGLPITTDEYASLKFGPITSKIYDRIKASANQSAHPTFWSAHIQRTDVPFEVTLARDPGTSELSPAEERLILEIFSADGKRDCFELADMCHLEFPEWQDPGETSTPIEISDIINALGLSEEESDHVMKLVGVQRAAFDLAE